ncbi:hypothetical protein L1049_020358 [Liquidambar formosana]|uniref:PHD-type domain-containing protein n=1 Tax=Liquidambar formosana TaxID=63359 RepID=A0AAP0X5Y6_LIQFO
MEVRQFEEGLRGSWHPGIVVGVSELRRSVEYDELLCEMGDSKLIENILVTKAIEGLHRRRHVPSTYRGHIRPPPPQPEPDSCSPKFSFGVCVDAFFEDAWWEGVVFDRDENSNEQYVYFPDEGDERKFNVSDLRVSCIWDEYLGLWRERGVWILVELAKGLDLGGHLSHFIKRVWVRLQLNYGFLKMISEWTCGVQNLWSRYLMEVVDEIAMESSLEDHINHNILACPLRKGRKKSKNSQQISLKNNSICNPFVNKRNSNGFKLVRSSQNREDKASFGQPSSNKQSLIIKLKCKKKRGRPRIHKDKENHFQADSPFAVNEMVAGASLMQSNSTTEDKCDQIPNGCSILSDKRLNVSLPSQRKQSLKIKLKLGKPKPLIVCKAEGNQLQVDYQSGNKEVSNGSLLESNEIGQGNFSRLANDCLRQNTRKVFQVVDSKINQQLVQKRLRLKKSKPIVTKKHKNNKYAFNSTRMAKELAHDVSHVQENQSVGKRRNVTKPKHFKTNLAVVCRLGQRKKEASHVLTNERNCSTKGKRISKNFHEAKAKIKGPLKEAVKVLDAIRTQDGFSASCCHPALPFANSGKKVRLKDMVSSPRKRKRKREYRGWQQSDPICILCQDGGEIILCDHCPTSYHLNCIDLKDIPDGKWFCPSCRCGLCGLRDSCNDNQLFTDVCHQCSRQYHVDCLRRAGDSTVEKFCSTNCFELCDRLHQLLGISYETRVDGLTWKMIRSTINDCNSHNRSRIDTSIELSRALEVMHECFQPVIEPHTRRDLVQDVFFNSVC